MDPVILHGVSEGVAIGFAAVTGAASFGAGVLYARLKDRDTSARSENPIESMK